MRSIVFPAVLILTSALSISAALAADDVMVNGLHCNQLCQAWLGVNGTSGGQPPTAARRSALSEITPAIALPRVQARRSPVVVVSLAPPLSREPTSSVVQSFATAALRPAYRQVATQPAPTKRPSAVLTASREFAPAENHAPPPNLTPAPTVRIVPLASAPSTAARAARAAASLDVSDADGAAGNGSRTVTQLSPVNGAIPRREASYETSDPMSDDARPDPRSKTVQRTAPMRSSLRMEPGLTTLPRLDDVVAVHGTIMIETAEDKALAKRQMADLIKATTRPKQFNTGFIGQPEIGSDASKVVTGAAE